MGHRYIKDDEVAVDVSSKIQMHSGIMYLSNTRMKAYKIGNVIMLYLNTFVDSGASAVGTEYTLFDVDASIKPLGKRVAYALGEDDSMHMISVDTNGAVKVETGSICQGQISWYIA